MPQDSVHSVKTEEKPPIREDGGTVSDFGKTVSDFGGTVSDFGDKQGWDRNRRPPDIESSTGPVQKGAARKKGIGKLAGIAAGLLVVCVAGIALLSQGDGSEPARPGGDTTISGEVSASGAAGGTYRVAVVGPDGFSFAEEIRASLETHLDEKVTAAGSTVQVEQVAYSVYNQEDEVLRLTQELPSQNYDVIVSIGSESCARAISEACHGTESAIVYSAVLDPESAGLTGLSNVTGVTDIGAESILQAIQALTPDAERIGVFYTEGNILEEPISKQLQIVLEQDGFECSLMLDAETLVHNGVDAVFTPSGDRTDTTQELSDLFSGASIPLYTTNEYMMNCGALALIRMDYSIVGEQTADMVFQILQGGALPAVQQAKAEILVNQTVAEQHGMTIDEGNGISFLTPEDLTIE